MKILRRAMPILVTMALILATAAPVGAWRPWSGTHDYYYTWASGAVRYCIHNAPNTVAHGTVKSGVERWDTVVDRIELTYDTIYTGTCRLNIYFFNDPNGTPAFGGPVAYSGYRITSAEIWINNAVPWWHYGADQQCYVGVGNGCLPDLFTAVFHETGHAIGIAHNHTIDAQRCVTGYHSTAAWSACSYYGDAVMHWNAGVEFLNGGVGYGYYHQGYRHLQASTDDILAADALYGW